jgi:hypothetical protein
MHDICVPIPHFRENEIAEVEVKVGDKKSSFNFRVESFNWELSDSKTSELTPISLEEKISHLRENIETYDENWELVQIFTPAQGSKYIQVLFRQRKLVQQD